MAETKVTNENAMKAIGVLFDWLVSVGAKDVDWENLDHFQDLVMDEQDKELEEDE